MSRQFEVLHEINIVNVIILRADCIGEIISFSVLGSSIKFNEGETTIISVKEREFAMLSSNHKESNATLIFVRLLQPIARVK